jgi:DNA-directed RNA polymerase subunit RPC12/RpoP
MCKDDWHDENRVTDDVFNVRCPHCGGRKLTRYKCPEYEE